MIAAAADNWIGLGLAVAGNVAFFFRYRVDDLEVFLLPSVALLCACAGVAAQALADVIAEVRANGVPPQPAPTTLTSPVNLRTQPQRRPEVAPGSQFHRQWVAARANGPVRIVLP